VKTEPTGKQVLLLRYGAGSVVALLLTALGLYVQSFSFGLAASESYRMLSNAFTVTGTLFLGVGALVWVANEEVFFGLFYGLGHAVRMLIPGRKDKDDTYYDYVEKQRAKGKVKGYAFILVIGAVFMAVAVIFLLLFNSVA